MLLAVAVAVGCGSEESTAAPEPAGDEALVEYTRSGGFAPTYQRLTVQADGDVVIETGLSPGDRKRTELTLSEAELDELRTAVEAADLEAVEPGEYVCADCFGYTIEAGGVTADLTDVDFQDDSGAEIPPEVDDLQGLLAAALDANAPSDPSIGG